MLIKTLKIVVGLLVLLVGGSWLLPRYPHIERVMLINTPAATVFPLVNNLHEFNRWSPWAKLDSTTVYVFSGPDEGVGARMSWKGDPKKVGEGRQEIVESEELLRVKTALDFGQPGTATATVTLKDQGLQTLVTWSLDQDTGFNPLARIFGLFMNKMVGSDYEAGLVALKQLAEANAH